MNYSKDELEHSLFQLNSMLYKIKTSNDTLTLKNQLNSNLKSL